MNKLTYLNSETITAFKARVGADSLKVVKNPATDKLFFICGGKSGAVGDVLGKTADELLVSNVVNENGEEFLMLHKEGAGELEAIVSF